MFCPDCGKQTPEGKRFCVHCGADIESALTPPSVTPAPGKGGSCGDEETVLGLASADAFEPGAMIAERYQVISVLGRGGMGGVYRVHDRDLGEECALKIMHPVLMASERAVERFVQEVRISRHLFHRNIVRVHDLGQWTGHRYLTMELLEGCTLREWLKEKKRNGQRVPIETAVSIASQVLKALEYAHSQTIHRDIKPENIFLTDDGENFRVRLLDFGIAKALDTETLTTTTASMGTAYYVAPEQLRGEEDVDARADLYAVAVVLYEMLVGELPTGVFPKPSEARDDLDGAWDQFVLKAMERDRERRPESAAAMSTALRGLHTGREELQEEFGLHEETETPASQSVKRGISGRERKATRIRWILMVAAFIVVAVALGKWGTSSWNRVGPTRSSGGDAAQTRAEDPAAGQQDQTATLLRQAEEDARESIKAEDPVIARHHLEVARSLGAQESLLGEFENTIASLEQTLEERAEAGRKKQEARDREVKAARQQGELLGATKAALESGDLDLAAKKLGEYEKAGGDPSEVAALTKRIDEAVQAADLAEQWRQEEAAVVAELENLLSLAESSLESDAFGESRGYLASYRAKTGESERANELEGLIDSLERAWKEQNIRKPGDVTVITITGVEYAFRWIPAGEDVLGSPPDEACRDEDERQWTAGFSEGFWMGETEVTQGQWWAVMGFNSSQFSTCGSTCPAEKVSWDDVQEYVRKLNGRVSGGGFRLPHEAEWEYAARAGTDTPFNSYCPNAVSNDCKGDVPCLDRIGWYEGNARKRTRLVAMKQPNAWGLYDMHGNVWEWCQDWYGDYPSIAQVDYLGPRFGSQRVIRGGSWVYGRSYLRSANRSRVVPNTQSWDVGFRLVMYGTPWAISP